MNKCGSCNEEKSEEDFHKSKRSKTGFNTTCKTCCNERKRVCKEKYRDRYLEKAREYANDRYHQNTERELERAKVWRENNVQEAKDRSRRQYDKFTHKAKARRMVQQAIRMKTITRPESCSRCNCNCVPEGHHQDYSKPLEVEWLCKGCHASKHKI